MHFLLQLFSKVSGSLRDSDCMAGLTDMVTNVGESNQWVNSRDCVWCVDIRWSVQMLSCLDNRKRRAFGEFREWVIAVETRFSQYLCHCCNVWEWFSLFFSVVSLKWWFYALPVNIMLATLLPANLTSVLTAWYTVGVARRCSGCICTPKARNNLLGLIWGG